MEGNTAPTLLDVNATLNSELEDSLAPSGAVGTLVSSFVALLSPNGGPDNVVDFDTGALAGIALTAVDSSHGSWFYSLDGGANWMAVGTVSQSNALLLVADSDTQLYFQPNANYNGTLAQAITFQAWDRTSGVEGARADASVNGGSTPSRP